MNAVVNVNAQLEKFAEVQAAVVAASAAIVEGWKLLTLEEKLAMVIKHGDSLDDALGHLGWYTGTFGSLYDDFYWERHQTMTVSQVFDMTRERMNSKDGADLIAEIIAGKDTGPRASVLCDMLEKGIGRAEHDW